jgi:Transketolase, C-terminal domain/2-oxoacid dehydrogenases acyltransferase (catalytic domain)
VRRTGRLCVVHEDVRTMGLGAEVTAMVCEAALDHLKAPPARVTMPDVAGIPVADPLEDALIPTPEAIGAAVRALLDGRGARRHGSAGFDPATPEASSVTEVCLGEAHLDRLIPAVVAACRAFPRCNAEFTWDGIRLHPEVRLDLDLGPHAPARGDGTFTLVDYGAGSSLLGIAAVRPGQTAALRVGAVRQGRAWLALTVDHRAVDGAEAGRFLAHVRMLVEEGS